MKKSKIYVILLALIGAAIIAFIVLAPKKYEIYPEVVLKFEPTEKQSIEDADVLLRIASEKGIELGQEFYLADLESELAKCKEEFAAEYTKRFGEDSKVEINYETEIKSEVVRRPVVGKEGGSDNQNSENDNERDKGRFVTVQFVIKEINVPSVDQDVDTSGDNRIAKEEANSDIEKEKERFKILVDRLLTESEAKSLNGVFAGFYPPEKDLHHGTNETILQELYNAEVAYYSELKAGASSEDGLLEKEVAAKANTFLTNICEPHQCNRVSNYIGGYRIWLELLIDIRMHGKVWKNHAIVDEKDKSRYDPTEIWNEILSSARETKAKNYTSFGKYRLDGSTATLGYYALICVLEETKAPNLKKLIPPNEVEEVRNALDGWMKKCYPNGMNLSAAARYGPTGAESGHLMGCKALYLIIKGWHDNDQDAMEQLKDFFIKARGGEGELQKPWQRVTSYYDYCYMIRALALAARLEAITNKRYGQAVEYMEWASELFDAHGKREAFKGHSHKSDVSPWYRLLANICLTKGQQLLKDEMEYDVRSSSN